VFLAHQAYGIGGAWWEPFGGNAIRREKFKAGALACLSSSSLSKKINRSGIYDVPFLDC
jgi:hypothetical protein